MKGLSFSQVRWPTLAALALIAAVLIDATRYVLGQATIIIGNVDDFFIALNAGYVVVQEGLAHPSIHSPFGEVYFLLSANSFRLIERFPQWLSLDKIHMFTSMQWMAVISVLFFAFRRLQDGGRKFEPWLLALLLLICVQAKDLGTLKPLPNWYGTYNYHLWALLILQAANHYCWKGRNPKGPVVFWLGVVEAFVLVIAFNYKISFFLAGCGLSLLPLFYLGGWQGRVAFYSSLLASAAIMMAALAGIGVPFLQYFHDVLFAARAKSVHTATAIGQFCVALAYMLIIGKVASRPAEALLSETRMVSISRVSEAVRRYAFHGVVAAAVAMGALGDFFSPWWPYVVVGLWAVICSSEGPTAETREPADRLLVRNVAAVLVTILAGFALLSLHVIADDANTGPTQNDAIAEAISFAPRPLSFIHFPMNAGIDDLLASKLFAIPSDLPQRLLEFSTRDESDQARPVVQAVGVMATTNYIKDVNETVVWLNEIGSAAKGTLAISHMGFSNPWPLLTGNRFTDGSPHWLHVGTTVSPRQVDAFLGPLSGADVTVVPLISVNDPEQAILNCAFYEWNIRNGGLFVPQHLAGYNLIFVRKGGRLPVSQPAPVQVDEAGIQRRCDNVLAAARTSG